MKAPGQLAIVLHTHMPYVEGFDRWPFGEEWLWEAIATSYLPLLALFTQQRAPLTCSLTPVLCDQLAAAQVPERCLRYLETVRLALHEREQQAFSERGERQLAAAVAASAADYRWAVTQLTELGGDLDLLAALRPYAQWTSAATHALLPLLATDVGAELQISVGVAAHRRRFGGWQGGFWLPECAYAPWLDPLLLAAGVRAVCLDLTDHYGRGAAEQLRPLATPAGLTVVPIERELMELVWSEGGYPAAGGYRDYHRQTTYGLRVWNNDGEPYCRDRALQLAKQHAADFVGRVRERLVAGCQQLGGPALAVCAFDTELFGHWWYEGVVWLTAVVAEAERQGWSWLRWTTPWAAASDRWR